jgi:two-component system, chemotaxis family, sensor kinase CheA
MSAPLDISAFVGKFVEEARDRLKALGEALLGLEQTPGHHDAMGEAMRQAHSLKGSALMLGFTDISQISHQLEDLFVAARKSPSLLNSAAFDVIFGSLDVLSARVEQLAKGDLEPFDITQSCNQISALLAPPAPAAPGSDPVSERVRGSDPVTERGTGARVTELRQSLRVPVEKLNRLTHLAPEMVVQSLKAFERHAELRRLERILSRLRDRVREARVMPETADVDRGAQLGEYADALDSLTRRMREFLVNFSDDRVRLNLITEDLRQSVIELTMLPIAHVFDAFPRAVRDLARAFEKEIELTIRGRDTELDKKIIEQIGEPLIHLVRNAVDHGIEAPAERVRLGKPAAGQLGLSAEQQGNRILIVLRDDGGGLDPARLREAAVRKGVASAADVARWMPQQLFELIFQPGFSTRESATDVSGRGVGMDIVKSVVERLGGTVRLQSELNRGTTVTLNLPLSLALLRVVLVEAGDELFAFPTAAVRRILQVSGREVAQFQQESVVDISGEMIPVCPLAGMLTLPAAPEGSRQTMLVAETSEGRFGMLVDAVHEEQELVFKELRGPLRNQRTFTGAALLGNGDIVPILDVSALFDLVSGGAALAATPAVERRAVSRRTRVLVVDDSLVAGELQKSILIAAGYEAEIAPDGAEALDALRQKEWDLVIADVDMPRVNGFELTARLRADERFHDIPVIIVTGRDSVDDRRRGFEVGADAYVLKREFDQNQLLDTVRRLIGRGAESARNTYV